MVPKVGKFSAVLSNVDGLLLVKEEALVIVAVVLARSVASYWQQALLWDAALNSVHKIRVYVFEKVLSRDLGFFEGSGGVSSGDVAYRITAEASDVTDTTYSLLNVMSNLCLMNNLGLQFLLFLLCEFVRVMEILKF